MSITVNFSTESKRENSTKQLNMSSSHGCNFKNGCSMLEPTLLLELNDSNFPGYSAFKIGKRYYNLTDIQSVRNNLFEVSGKVDPLATYKSEILTSTQYVCYSNISGGIWLPDTRIPVLRNAITSPIATANLDLPSRTGSYIISILGQNGVDCYRVSRNTMQQLLSNLQTWSDDIQTGFTDMIDAVQEEDVGGAIKAIGKALTGTGFIGNKYEVSVQCIRSAHWVPFSSALVGGTETEIYLGSYPTGLNGYKISTSYISGNVPISIPWHFSDYRRSLCESVYLYLPFVGMVNVNVDDIINDTSILIKYSATATDGQICYEIQCGNKVIGTYGSNCLMEIPIGVNQKSSLGDIATTIASGYSKAVSSGVSAMASLLRGDVVNAAESGMSARFGQISTVYNTIDVALSSNPTTIGGIGGGAGAGLDITPKCFTVSHPTVIEPPAMQPTMGVPTMRPMQLSSCSGFCQCANAHVNISGTSTERNMVDAYLNNGFYIE